MSHRLWVIARFLCGSRSMGRDSSSKDRTRMSVADGLLLARMFIFVIFLAVKAWLADWKLAQRKKMNISNRRIVDIKALFHLEAIWWTDQRQFVSVNLNFHLEEMNRDLVIGIAWIIYWNKPQCSRNMKWCHCEPEEAFVSLRWREFRIIYNLYTAWIFVLNICMKLQDFYPCAFGYLFNESFTTFSLLWLGASWWSRLVSFELAWRADSFVLIGILGDASINKMNLFYDFYSRLWLSSQLFTKTDSCEHSID